MNNASAAVTNGGGKVADTARNCMESVKTSSVIDVTSSRKFNSKSLSASSSTKQRKFVLSVFPRKSFNVRPGEPTTTWGGALAIFSSSSSMGTPPMKHATERAGLMYHPRRCTSSATWRAISRVGASASPCVSDLAVSVKDKSTEQKAIVLPVPDFAWTITSWPVNAAGILRCCTGEGCSQPISRRLRNNGWANPRSAKLQLCVSASATSLVLKRGISPGGWLGRSRRQRPSAPTDKWAP
mmetsp:Transcript_22667/g.63214  ORF Transcript_22667/g.63214 Transcript_22667/m.63214 type:complete len:240 (-) Transcript_22667:36-755(-)